MRLGWDTFQLKLSGLPVSHKKSGTLACAGHLCCDTFRFKATGSLIVATSHNRNYSTGRGPKLRDALGNLLPEKVQRSAKLPQALAVFDALADLTLPGVYLPSTRNSGLYLTINCLTAMSNLEVQALAVYSSPKTGHVLAILDSATWPISSCPSCFGTCRVGHTCT